MTGSRHRWLFPILLVVVCGARSNAWQTACDRLCLTRIADAYFAAMAAHDPKKAPLAANVRFTEDTQVRTIGEGLWKTPSEAPTTFKVYVADPVAGQLGGIVMMKDADKPVQVTVRLKVQNQQITQAEHLVWRTVSTNALANLQTPRPAS